jgi:hypothetical protein
MDPIDVLSKVDAFYASAWDKLLVFTSILVATVGIIIPILFNWLQNRTLRIREETIKKDIENTLVNKFKELEKTFKENNETTMNEKLEAIESKLIKKSNLLQGGIFILQGGRNFTDKLYKQALLDYCTSANSYLFGDDLLTVQRINKTILNILNKISKSDLNALQEEENQPDQYIADLKGKNENGIFSDIIKELQRGIKKVQNCEDLAVTK